MWLCWVVLCFVLVVWGTASAAGAAIVIAVAARAEPATTVPSRASRDFRACWRALGLRCMKRSPTPAGLAVGFGRKTGPAVLLVAVRLHPRGVSNCETPTCLGPRPRPWVVSRPAGTGSARAGAVPAGVRGQWKGT